MYFVLFYAFSYSLNALGFCAICLGMSNYLKTETILEFKGLVWKRKEFSILILCIFFSFMGFPPTSLFFSKIFLLFHLVKHGFYILASVTIIMSILAFYYFLKIIKLMIYNKASPTKSFITVNTLYIVISLLCFLLNLFLPFTLSLIL